MTYALVDARRNFASLHNFYKSLKSSTLTPSVNLSHAQFLSPTDLVRKSQSKVEKRAEKRNRWTFWNPPSPSRITSDSVFLSEVLSEYCWLQSLSWNPFGTTSMVSILGSVLPSCAGVSIEPGHESNCCRTRNATMPTVLLTVPCSSAQTDYSAISRNQLCWDSSFSLPRLAIPCHLRSTKSQIQITILWLTSFRFLIPSQGNFHTSLEIWMKMET